MKNSIIFKIKDSVDLYLVDDELLKVYFLNTRTQKNFRLNKESIFLIEQIDGEKSLGQIKKLIHKNFKIKAKFVDEIFNNLLKHKIISPINHDENILNDDDHLRFSRQINYFAEFFENENEGSKAQKRLMDSKILIFGVGAVGGDIALILAMAGVRNFVLYDYDRLEKSDLSRHLYFKEKYENIYKTKALKKELKSINMNVKIKTINKILKPQSEIESLIKDVDFIINSADEPYIGYSSSKISRICVKHNKPHFIAGGFDAHLASTGELIIPYITPCVECYASHFRAALKDWQPQKHPVEIRYKDMGGLAAMSLFSAAYASAEIIKILAGLVDMKENFKMRGEFLFDSMKLHYLKVEKNPKCSVCGEKNEG